MYIYIYMFRYMYTRIHVYTRDSESRAPTSLCCSQVQFWEMALFLLSEMHGRLRPSAVTYNSVLSACRPDAHMHRAEMILKSGPQLCSCIVGGPKSWEHSVALAVEMQRAEMVLDVVSYTALVAAAGPRMAMALLVQMQARQVKPETMTLNAALKACQSALHWDAAVRIFSEAQEARVRLDSVSCTALLDSLAWSGSGGSDQLLEILPTLQRKNLTSVLLEPQADELKQLGGSMQPDLKALAALSATLSLTTFAGERWAPSWASWGLVLVLLRRTVLACGEQGLLRRLEGLSQDALDSLDSQDVRRQDIQDRLGLSNPFGLGPVLANLALEAGAFLLSLGLATAAKRPVSSYASSCGLRLFVPGCQPV